MAITCRPGRHHLPPSARGARRLVLVGGVAALLAIGGSQVGGMGRTGADSSYSVPRADLNHLAQTAPTTTSVPPTTVAPTTTSVPPTTVAPTTTSVPPTTVAPTTTSVPPTTVAPTTTSVPPTTVAPTTTSVPPTTVAPRRTPTHATTTHRSSGRTQAAASSASSTSDPSTTTTTTPTPAATPGLSSENWSGYVLTNGGYQEVGAEWTVPTLNCTVVPNGGTSDWVGVNGWVHPSQLFQAGTASTCSGGSQTNFVVWSDGALGYAWQEQFSVNTGDVIQAEVSQTASGGWTALVTDLTSGQSATASEAVPYAGASAEWVAEDSGVLGSSALTPLADFGVVSFTNLSVSPSTGFSYSDAIEMQRVDGSDEAMPSPVQGDASFSVTYEPTS